MNTIAFIDSEIDPRSHKILDLGGIKSDGNTFHHSSQPDFTHFLRWTDFVAGHNILNHDIKYIGKALYEAGIPSANIIDTLHLSPL
ncbi:MAG: hypothetical protein NTY32_00775, partial [Bacteroidia bacterium]|nr:hypothetical protein [Bacteroidia bacterium]